MVYTKADPEAAAYANEFRAFTLRTERFNGRDGKTTECKKLAKDFEDLNGILNSPWWKSPEGRAFILLMIHHCKRDGSCCKGRTDAERRVYTEIGGKQQWTSAAFCFNRHLDYPFSWPRP